MFKLDLQSRQPIYEQLKNRICEHVMLGALKPDDQLPSVRSLSRELGVNPNTVQKAYQELEREKIIYSVAGRGSYVSPIIDIERQLNEEHVKKIQSAARHARSCGISLDRILEAVRDAYKEGE